MPGGGWEVSSPVYCHGVHLEDHGHALISDNWFDLPPGVSVRLAAAGGIAIDTASKTTVHLSQKTEKSIDNQFYWPYTAVN